MMFTFFLIRPLLIVVIFYRRFPEEVFSAGKRSFVCVLRLHLSQPPTCLPIPLSFRRLSSQSSSDDTNRLVSPEYWFLAGKLAMGHVGISSELYCSYINLLAIKFSVRKRPHRKIILCMCLPIPLLTAGSPLSYSYPLPLSGGCPHSRRRTIQNALFSPNIRFWQESCYGARWYLSELVVFLLYII